MHHPSPADSNSKTASEPHIEILPPTLSLRIGKRRLTLSRRPRKLASHLLHGLLRRSWRSLFGKALRVSLAAAAVSAAWNSVAMAAAPPVNTLPTGGTIVAGSATMAQTANTLTINQTSSQAIGNFTSFSIGANASVIINEPNSAAAFLARVTGTDPSQLYGLLQSNGTVMLINQNGILVGPSGVVDVARFIASTINISDSDFLAGRLTFANSAGTSGTVENQGLIKTASGGSVYLIGSNVSNSGIIHSPNGEVILAAGASVQLVDTGTPGVTVNITGAAGNVTNLGTITAEAGTIGIAAGLINNSGSVNASSAVADGGRVFLRASNSLTTTATSTITADGATNGGSVVLYSAGSAFIDGKVSATGATGTGGYVETSGLTSLDVVNAPIIGAGGTWYIDPYDLVVADTTSGGTTISGTGPYAIYSCGSVSTISASCISAWLSEDLNVTLATTGGSGSGGNITVNSAITKSAGSYAVLTLDADDNIYINANITSTSGVLGLNLISNYHGYNDASGIQSIVLSGATVALNGGVLNVSDAYSGSQQGNLTITNGGVLNLSYNTSDPNAVGGGSVYAGNISVDATSSVIGVATSGSTLSVSGAYTNNGTLAISNAAVMNISSFVNNGDVTLNNVTACSSGDVSNAGTLSLTNATLNVSGALTNSGTANLTAGTITDASGFTNEAAGTVNASYASTFNGLVVNAGTMTLDSTAGKPNGYTGATAITLNSGITNTGRLAVLGTVTNNGNVINSATGNITVGGGSIVTTLTVSGNVNSSGNLTLASGSNLTASTGTLNNDGTITMTAANMTFAAVNNNADGTLSGTGTVNAAVYNDGTIAPGGAGTIGTLAINGSFNQYSDGTLLLDFASDTSYDQLNVNPNYFIYLDGTLQTRLLGTYVPTLGTSFQPFGSSSNVSGIFRHVLGNVTTNSSGGLEMLKSFTTDSGIFLTMSGPENSTFNGGDGDWGNISNWSTSYFPTAIDSVTVAASNTLEHSSVEGSDIVNSITLNNGATLNVSGGTVTVLGDVTASSAGTVNVIGANLSAGNLTLASNSVLNVTSSSNVSVSNNISLTDNSNITVGSDFTGGSVTAGNVSADATSNITVHTGSLATSNLTSNGSVVVGYSSESSTPAAVLQVTGTATLNNLSLYSTGEVTGTIGSVFNVTGNVTDYGLINTSGSVILVQTSDQSNTNLTVGNITAANVVLQSQAGAIVQGNVTNVLHVTKQLATSSALGTTLDNSNNQIAAYSGVNTGSGDIVLVNNLNTTDTSAVKITGLTNMNGNISVDNTGAMVTTAFTSTGSAAVDTMIASLSGAKDGSVTATSTGSTTAQDGTVTLATHSPLTVGANVTANGNITLQAGDGTAASDILTIAGKINSINGVVSLVANQTVYVTAATTTTGNPDPGNITSNLISSVNNSQNTNTGNSNSNSTSAPSSNTSSSTTFTTSNGQTMTTGGDEDTFGGSDSNEQQGSGTKNNAVAKLYCS